MKVKVGFGPTGYGPPWQGVDAERWAEPGKPMWGFCGKMNWTFIVPFEVADSEGRIWKFSHWEDNSTNPKRTIFVNNDLVLEAYYSEPGTGDSRITSSITCLASPSELFKRSVVTISGSILPSVGGATVTLNYIKPDGSSFTRSVATSSSGAYSDSYSPESLGIYYVQASWSGNDEYDGFSYSVSFSIIEMIQPLEPDFSVSVDKPYSILVLGEPEQKIIVTLSSKQGFSSEVNLSLSDVPKGVVTKLLPSTLTLPPTGMPPQ